MSSSSRYFVVRAFVACFRRLCRGLWPLLQSYAQNIDTRSICMKKLMATTLAMAYVAVTAWTLQAQQPPRTARVIRNGNPLLRPATTASGRSPVRGGLTYDASRVRGLRGYGRRTSRTSSSTHRRTGTSCRPARGRTGRCQPRVPRVRDGNAADTTGRFQTDLMALEARSRIEVPERVGVLRVRARQRDSRRLGTAHRRSARPLLECHTKAHAVERTFVQFFRRCSKWRRQRRPGAGY